MLGGPLKRSGFPPPSPGVTPPPPWSIFAPPFSFGLQRPLRLTWRQIYEQFGAAPARANETRTVDAFRTDCLRELKKIKNAWPDLHYKTVKGALVVAPSAPRIPPSQLRLVE